MKPTLLFSFLFISVLLHAQNPGDPDLSFGQDGLVYIADSNTQHIGVHMVSLPDGKLLFTDFSASSNNQEWGPGLVRLLPDGTLDPDFGVNGRKPLDIQTGNGVIFKLAVTPSGKILVIGQIITTNESKAFVVQCHQDGSLDNSFAQNGIAIVDISLEDDAILCIQIKSDGKILLGGFTNRSTPQNYYDLLLVQLLPDGTPDPNFGTNGVSILNYEAGNEGISAIKEQADGKIVALTYINNNITSFLQVMRFMPNGNLDPEFGVNGRVELGSEEVGLIGFDLAIQNDQKIIFCGTAFELGIGANSVIYRLLPNGNLDPDFGIDGIVVEDLGLADSGRSLLIQPDGKIVMGAESLLGSAYTWLLRYNQNGKLDSSFGIEGKVQSPAYVDTPEYLNIVAQPNGKLLLICTEDLNIYVRRYYNDLGLDATQINQEDLQLVCAPNPATEWITLSWEQTNAPLSQCLLFDARGNQVQEFMLSEGNDGPGARQQALQLAPGLPSGQYFLILKIGNAIKTVAIQKI